MGNSVLVFVSHSSEDKETYIEPIVRDLEDCYLNIWIDKRKILPGDNLRKSILRDGLDKADVVLIFFTEQSLKSAWVDQEIKHVLREELKKGNDFDLNKIISIFDTEETYSEISKRYPELTDDLLHLMPNDYDKTHLSKLVSAIWSKYLSLQGGDVETQRQLLAKEKEIFQKDKEIQDIKLKLRDAKANNSENKLHAEFEGFLDSGKADGLIANKDVILNQKSFLKNNIENISDAIAFGLITVVNNEVAAISERGKEFFKWYVLEKSKKP